MSPQPDEVSRDAADLRRGAAVNALSVPLKALNPLLFVLVVRAYGARDFGLFTVAQATLLLVARVAALGLDKGLLWWIPRQPEHEKRSGVRSSLFVTGAASVLWTALFVIGADPAVLRMFDANPALSLSLRVMSLGIVPQVLSDVLASACMGRRKMGPQVFAKDALVPTSLALFAVLLHAAGLGAVGLGIAYFAANVLGCAATAWAYRREMANIPAASDRGWAPPRELVRYALPFWVAEIGNSFLQRMDTYLVAFLTGDLRLVGIYGVVTRVADVVRMIRRSFDPIVLAIAAEVANLGDKARLRATYSYATFLVALVQLPVSALLVVFSREVLGLFGVGFESGATALTLLIVAWWFNGLTALSGIVVSAFGRSDLSLYNTLGAAAFQGLLGVLLIPPYGLAGAALGVGGAYVAQGVIQLLQMRFLSGGWNYDARLWRLPWICAATAAAWFAAWLVLPVGMPDLPRRIVAFSVALVVYGAFVFTLWRGGALRPAAARS